MEITQLLNVISKANPCEQIEQHPSLHGGKFTAEQLEVTQVAVAAVLGEKNCGLKVVATASDDSCVVLSFKRRSQGLGPKRTDRKKCNACVTDQSARCFCILQHLLFACSCFFTYFRTAYAESDSATFTMLHV